MVSRDLRQRGCIQGSPNMSAASIARFVIDAAQSLVEVVGVGSMSAKIGIPFQWTTAIAVALMSGRRDYLVTGLEPDRAHGRPVRWSRLTEIACFTPNFSLNLVSGALTDGAEEFLGASNQEVRQVAGLDDPPCTRLSLGTHRVPYLKH